MNEVIENLYNEIYAPKLTPQELINNLHLPNYESIEFSKSDTDISAVAKCKLDTGQKASFFYTFNEDNMLISLTINYGNKHEKLYDREKSIDKCYKLARKHFQSNSYAK